MPKKKKKDKVGDMSRKVFTENLYLFNILEISA